MEPWSTSQEPVFRRDGEVLVPGDIARGPWYEGSLHGSAMLAALAWAVERHPSDVPRQVSRLTVDMMRAAPLAPLRPVTRCLRSGKNVDFIDVELHSGDELFVRGSALRTRVAHVAPAPDADEHVFVPVVPDRAPYVFVGADNGRAAFHHGLEVRIGDAEGPPLVWFRLGARVVASEPNSSFVTLAAIADWTYAVPMLHRRAHGGDQAEPATGTAFAINVDTSIHAIRPMAGEWLGVASTVTYGGEGAGASSARIFDRDGIVGFSSQSILVRGPDGAPLHLKEVPSTED